MPISLSKVTKIKSKIDLKKPSSEISAEIKKSLEEMSKCDQEKNQPKKDKTPRYVIGKRVVVKRLPRKFTATDVKRITRQVLKNEDDNCKSLEVLAVTLYILNQKFDWVAFIRKVIALLKDFRTMYEMIAQYAAVKELHADVDMFMDFLNDLNVPFISDIRVFLHDILDIPLDIVLFFEPLDEFLQTLIGVLEFIIQIITILGV